MLEVSGVLAGALSRMENDGWCQHHHTEGMASCPVRAIWDEISTEHDWNDGGRAIMMVCLKALRGGTGIANVALWNDHPHRTFAQVREVFRRAICESELKEKRAFA